MYGKTAAIISALALALICGTGVIAGAAGTSSAVGVSTPTPTAFTYQGQLKSQGASYSGICDFRFSLWDSLSGGAQVGLLEEKTDVSLASGLFTVLLDFGSGAFQGDGRWLEISVRCPSGAGEYMPLTPRQPLTASPYALYSITAGNAWSLTGNAGTTPATNYVGTSDNQALELKVNGQRALRLEPNATSPNVIGGYSGNAVAAGVIGATIGGGGGSGNLNRVTDTGGTLSGGRRNQAGDGAGAISDKPYATVGGGEWNTAAGDHATVDGGYHNTASGQGATVGGGYNHTAGNDGATVGGGGSNTVGGYMATAGGGAFNTAAGSYATVGGGDYNTADGNMATVPGGDHNLAQGEHSFAAGHQAKAKHAGAFVWADSTDEDLSSSAADQFLVRASGGVGINTDAPTPNTLTVGGAGLRVATDGTTFKRIQAGTATLGQGGAGTGTRKFTVPFPAAFSGAPAVIATARGGNYSDTFVITTTSISSTQFDVNVYRVDIPGGGWTQNLQLDWIAWEQ